MLCYVMLWVTTYNKLVMNIQIWTGKKKNNATNTWYNLQIYSSFFLTIVLSEGQIKKAIAMASTLTLEALNICI